MSPGGGPGPARWTARWAWLATVGLAAAWLAAVPVEGRSPAGSPARPGPGAELALVVLVAVDQLRRDRLEGGLPGGLGRWVRDGRTYRDAALDHAVTSTCPGHAVMLTGRHPGPAGITGNTWFDRSRWREVYCAGSDDPAHRTLGGSALRAPVHLRVDTLGDWLHAADPRSQVHAVAAKDRAAIMLGGQHPDSAVWFDEDVGGFTTSGWYATAVPAWLADWNGAGSGDRAGGTDGRSGADGADGTGDTAVARPGDLPPALRALPAAWRHPGNARPDDHPAEDDRHGRSSGHPLGSGGRAERIDQFLDSPWADRAVLDVALATLVANDLGGDGHPDLLAISLAATDRVGHLYGPFSAEADDTRRRLDQALGEFMSAVEARVGTGRVVWVLTSDHGALDLPEWLREQGTSTCRAAQPRRSATGLALRLWFEVWREFTAPFGNPADLVQFADGQIYISRAWAAARGIDPARVQRWVRHRLGQEAVVASVHDRSAIAVGRDEAARRWQRSIDPDRSGDLLVEVARDCLIGGAGGTGHGSPWDYDRAIPLAFLGPGINRGVVEGPARSVDIAPTLAVRLGIAVPPGLDGRVLEGVWTAVPADD